MSGVRLPFALSLAGHAVLLAAIALLVVTPPRPAPPALHSIELILAPPTPKPPPAPPRPRALPPPPVARPAPPKPPAIHPPPRPAPPPKPKPAPVRTPLPRVAAPPPRPQRKPVFRRLERPLPRRIRREPVRPRPVRPEIRREPIRPRYIPPPRYVPPPRYAPPPRYYAPPPRYAPPSRRAPPAAATISPGYRARLIGWIGAHTYYPQSARDAGEEGEVLLRFRIERSGRVADVSVVRSSGYPDLDAAALAMMRGAVVPPFPPSMPQESITVAVPIRFRLG